jgi:hypothetical protein
MSDEKDILKTPIRPSVLQKNTRKRAFKCQNSSTDNLTVLENIKLTKKIPRSRDELKQFVSDIQVEEIVNLCSVATQQEPTEYSPISAVDQDDCAQTFSHWLGLITPTNSEIPCAQIEPTPEIGQIVLDTFQETQLNKVFSEKQSELKSVTCALNDAINEHNALLDKRVLLDQQRFDIEQKLSNLANLIVTFCKKRQLYE